MIRFDAIAEDGVITIPTRYASAVSGKVSVIAGVDESPKEADAFDAHMAAIRAERARRPASIDDFKTFGIDTTDWKFDREAIHERGR